MSELPLADAVNRFQSNEDKFDTFINGDQDAQYTASDGSLVSSVRKLSNEISIDASTAARMWATLEEDVLVDNDNFPGKHSALHYALKTAADRVQTGLDATATADDRVQTGQDAAATAADRVQTGLDRTAATNAAATATAARDQTLAAFDSFDDRYLGSFAADPTTDNDGDPLVAGALHYNTTSGGMRIYSGSAWGAAYVSPDGLLEAANNLSDVSDPDVALTNLGGGATGVSVLKAGDQATGRTALGLGSAAVKNSEDTLTDGSNLPVGSAVKSYVDTQVSNVVVPSAAEDLTVSSHLGVIGGTIAIPPTTGGLHVRIDGVLNDHTSSDGVNNVVLEVSGDGTTWHTVATMINDDATATGPYDYAAANAEIHLNISDGAYSGVRSVTDWDVYPTDPGTFSGTAATMPASVTHVRTRRTSSGVPLSGTASVRRTAGIS